LVHTNQVVSPMEIASRLYLPFIGCSSPNLVQRPRIYIYTKISHLWRKIQNFNSDACLDFFLWLLSWYLFLNNQMRTQSFYILLRGYFLFFLPPAFLLCYRVGHPLSALR
jgi:hypothetical protein